MGVVLKKTNSFKLKSEKYFICMKIIVCLFGCLENK
ncbi:hypothetical protein SLEP1_g51799 [Rubroshorea leprosula]|uniref:Uncharacterized protein n=1 Tax=Rubroshorea leprosula TaxID=152421 RepID=A0AAV5M810_9ROSI|nr:hypothetical protein SLEP1_g51799 [Rubroshorea leprosula]